MGSKRASDQIAVKIDFALSIKMVNDTVKVSVVRNGNLTKKYIEVNNREFSEKLIYIETNFFVYLVECNVVLIKVFTLELCQTNTE